MRAMLAVTQHTTLKQQKLNTRNNTHTPLTVQPQQTLTSNLTDPTDCTHRAKVETNAAEVEEVADEAAAVAAAGDCSDGRDDRDDTPDSTTEGEPPTITDLSEDETADGDGNGTAALVCM